MDRPKRSRYSKTSKMPYIPKYSDYVKQEELVKANLPYDSYTMSGFLENDLAKLKQGSEYLKQNPMSEEERLDRIKIAQTHLNFVNEPNYPNLRRWQHAEHNFKHHYARNLNLTQANIDIRKQKQDLVKINRELNKK